MFADMMRDVKYILEYTEGMYENVTSFNVRANAIVNLKWSSDARDWMNDMTYENVRAGNGYPTRFR